VQLSFLIFLKKIPENKTNRYYLFGFKNYNKIEPKNMLCESETLERQILFPVLVEVVFQPAGFFVFLFSDV
jgi:hypothetical protein